MDRVIAGASVGLGQLIGDGDKITNGFFLRLHLNFPELLALKSLALKFFNEIS